MDARLAAACDFRLVSTYVPFVATIARAQGFLVVVAAAAPQLPAQVFPAALMLAAYFDALAHATVHTSAIAGHVAPVCFVWLARVWPHGGASWEAVGHSPDAQLTVDVLWLAAVHALLASYACRRKVPFGAPAILAVNAACVLFRLWLSVEGGSVLELHVRAASFYVFVFVHFYVFQTRAAWDEATHACVGPHLGLHFFFVDTRLAAVSLACTAVVCVRVRLQTHDHAQDTSRVAAESARASEKTRAAEAFVDVEDMAGLLQELRAAKAVALES
jgi:hypothetical protein